MGALYLRVVRQPQVVIERLSCDQEDQGTDLLVNNLFNLTSPVVVMAVVLFQDGGCGEGAGCGERQWQKGLGLQDPVSGRNVGTGRHEGCEPGVCCRHGWHR